MSGSVSTRKPKVRNAKKENKMNTELMDDLPTFPVEAKPKDDRTNTRVAMEQGTATDPTGQSSKAKKAKGSKGAKKKASAVC